MGEDWSWLTDLFGGGSDPGYQPGEPGYDTGGSTPWAGFDTGSGYQPGEPGYDTGGSTPYPGFDPSAFGGSGGGSNALASLAKLFGGSGSSGSSLLASLLPSLLGIGGGLYSANTQKNATQDVLNSINNSNDIIKSTLGGSGALYQPYRDAGLGALAKMQAMPPANLAGNFQPLGSGRGLTLGKMAGK